MKHLSEYEKNNERKQVRKCSTCKFLLEQMRYSKSTVAKISYECLKGENLEDRDPEITSCGHYFKRFDNEQLKLPI